MKKINNGLIRTNSNCIGCNKCLRACSFSGGMIASKDENDKNIVVVNEDRCFVCGACTDVCTHNAREINDDTERFFNDLKNGEHISLLIAPSFFANYYENYGEILGVLKKLGVNKLISVGLGAEISNWAYINYLNNGNTKGKIAQHCPSLVGYIERYAPELIDNIIPIHSALLCTAIYAKDKMNINDKLAFISPCVAKKEEIMSARGGNRVSYNVTFEKLIAYYNEKCIKADDVSDEIEFGIGTFFPIPGGLRENISWYLGDDIFVRQIEGERVIYEYIESNKNKIINDEMEYLFFEMLNCSKGCLYGTGCESNLVNNDDIVYKYMKLHKNIKNSEKFKLASESSYKERVELLNERFSGLNIDDYMCTYSDRSENCKTFIPTEAEVLEIFNSMNKKTTESMEIDCSVCGYDTCKDMCIAIYNGFNHKDNCIYFVREEVELERDRNRKAEVYFELATKDIQTGLLNRNAYYDWLKKQNSFENYAVIMFDLNDLKKCNDTYGHDVGDEYIQNAVDILKGAFSPETNFYRIGGDEFCAIIANAKSEEIIQSLNNMNIQTQKYNNNSSDIKMNIAAGYAFYDVLIDDNFNETQKRADRLMYIDKSRFKEIVS